MIPIFFIQAKQKTRLLERLAMDRRFAKPKLCRQYDNYNSEFDPYWLLHSLELDGAKLAK